MSQIIVSDCPRYHAFCCITNSNYQSWKVCFWGKCGSFLPIENQFHHLLRIQAKMPVYSLALFLSQTRQKWDKSQSPNHHRLAISSPFPTRGSWNGEKVLVAQIVFDLPPHNTGEELAEAYYANKFGFPVLVTYPFLFLLLSGPFLKRGRRRGSRGDNYRSGSERRKATFSAAVVIAKTRTDFVRSHVAETEKRGEKERKWDPTPMWKFTDEKIFLWMNGSVSIFL